MDPLQQVTRKNMYSVHVQYSCDHVINDFTIVSV
jgi:hypothetical protein